MKYEVTKLITTGPLKGTVVREETDVPFEVGFEVDASAWAGSGYIVQDVKVLEEVY